MNASPILGFFDEYRFLSNFAGPGFDAFGEHWDTNEHFYQAMKSLDPEEQRYVRIAPGPGGAKRRGRQITIQEGWDEYLKEYYMRLGLWFKFQDPTARQLLLDTGHRYLEETNTWGDVYWGRVDGVGLNRLGYMLMDLRHILRFPTASIGATTIPYNEYR